VPKEWCSRVKLHCWRPTRCSRLVGAVAAAVLLLDRVTTLQAVARKNSGSRSFAMVTPSRRLVGFSAKGNEYRSRATRASVA